MFFIILGILGVIEGGVLYFFYKKGLPGKIAITIFIVLLILTGVMIIPTINYSVEKNPRIPNNIKSK